MKKKVLAGAMAAAGYAITQNNISQAVANASRCIELKGDTARCGRVSRGLLDEEMRLRFDTAIKQHKSLQQEREVKRQAEEAKRQAEIAKMHERVERAKLKATEEIAKAEAKFKAEGWFEVAPGIYGRWCTNTCSNADVIGDATYWLMEVWAKDRQAGDIYAQINVLKDGVVIGWTNDTAFLSHGQKGVLTFSKYLPKSSSQYSAELVKFNARG